MVAIVVMALAMSVQMARASADDVPPCPGTGPVIDGPTPDSDSTTGTIRFVETLVDRTRSTEETASARAQPCRVLPFAVHVPTGATGPLPLILVVHGRDGDPRSLRPLLDTWTRAGYVVAAPTFPVTKKDDDDKPMGEEVERQAGDVRFAIDQLLDQDDDPSSPLFGRIDPRHIGAVGMSLGGMTVYGLISNTCCRDARISAAISMAGVYREFPHGRYVRRRVPVLLVQGDVDKGYHNSVEAYPFLAPPKWFVTLHGSLHSPPFEIPRGDEAPIVDATTTAFWNTYLKGVTRDAGDIVGEVRDSDGRASVVYQLAPVTRSGTQPVHA